MKPWLAAGALMFMVAFVVGHVMQFRAFQLLSPEQRNQVESFRATRSAARSIAGMGLGLLMLMLAAAIIGLGGRLPPVFTSLMLAVVIAPTVWAHTTFVRGLRALGLPFPFVTAIRRSRIVIATGVLLAFLAATFSSVVPP